MKFTIWNLLVWTTLAGVVLSVAHRVGFGLFAVIAAVSLGLVAVCIATVAAYRHGLRSAGVEVRPIRFRRRRLVLRQAPYPRPTLWHQIKVLAERVSL